MEHKTMYLLTYDHGGFVLWGDRVQARLDLVETWLQKYPDFRLGLDYEAFTFDEMEQTDPQFVSQIRRMLAQYPGRFGLGSTTYGQPLSLFISDESNVRQLTYAVRANLRHFGQTPNVYAISEFALHNQHPQLLRQCGYDMTLFRTHVMNYGYQKSFDSAYGVWRGKDGTSIPAIPTYTGAGEGYTNTTLDNWFLTRWPGESQYSPDDFERIFSKYEPLLASRYDDISNGKEELIAYAQQVKSWHFVLLEDLPAIYGDPVETLPTNDNDFHGRMPWGYCGNEIFNGVRASENAAAVAERVNALSVLLGGASQQPTLERAWQNTLEAQHHDVTICGLLDEAHRFIGDALRFADAAQTNTLDELAARFASPDVQRLLVCNPHDFPVSGWVATQGQTAAGLPTETDEGGTRVFVTLPPLSVQTFPTGKPAAPGTGFAYADGVLQTPFYRITLHTRGIGRIETADGVCIADNGDGALFCGFIEDGDYDSIGTWDVRIGAHSVTAVQTGTIGVLPFRFTMRLDRFSKRIDCTSSFDLHGERVGRIGVTKGIHTDYVVNGSVHENKLRFVLNTCLDTGRRMVRDLPFAFADWDDQVPQPEDFWYEGKQVLVDHRVPHDECFCTPCYLQGIYWLALRDASRGIAVFNRGCMGSAIEGNRINVPLIYANEYMCGTKMLNGTFENEFALYPCTSDESDFDLHQAALGYAYTLPSRAVPRGNGTCTSFAFNRAQNSGTVLLTALYPEDGGIYARFCNFSDKDASYTLDPTVGRLTAQTDLLGRETCLLQESTLTLHPWEVRTVRVVC